MLLSNAVDKTTETAIVSSSGKPEFAPSSQSVPLSHSQDTDRLVVWNSKWEQMNSALKSSEGEAVSDRICEISRESLDDYVKPVFVKLHFDFTLALCWFQTSVCEFWRQYCCWGMSWCIEMVANANKCHVGSAIKPHIHAVFWFCFCVFEPVWYISFPGCFPG